MQGQQQQQLSRAGSPGPSLAEIWLAIVGVERGLSSGGKWTLAKETHKEKQRGSGSILKRNSKEAKNSKKKKKEMEKKKLCVRACVCVFLIDSVCVRSETASAVAAEARSQSHYLGTIWMVMALQRPFHAIPWLDPSRLGHQIDFAEAFLCPKILRMNFVRLGVKQTSTSASLISPRRSCSRVGVASPSPTPSPSWTSSPSAA